jgi:hypothetical protein
MLVETGGEGPPSCKLCEYRVGFSPEIVENTNVTGGENQLPFAGQVEAY